MHLRHHLEVRHERDHQASQLIVRFTVALEFRLAVFDQVVKRVRAHHHLI